MKRLQTKNILFFLTLSLGMIFISPCYSLAALNVVKTWNDKADWQPWTKTNVQYDLMGGLRLSDVITGGFEPDGEARFQFLPGGVENSWVNSAHVSQDKITAPGNTNQLSVFYSVDNSGWYSENDLNSGLVPDSSGLYIKVVFHNDDGTNTPVLKSLTLSYDTKEEPKLLILKRSFLLGTGGNPLGTEKATFDPGDTSVIKVKIDPMGLSDLNLVVRDYRPQAFNIGVINSKAECGLNNTDNLLSSTFLDNPDRNYSEWRDVHPSSGISYLCYKYTINNTDQPKNDLIQSKLIVYDQDNFDENQSENQVISSYSGYQMVKGIAFTNSQAYAGDPSKGLDTNNVFPIDDFLSFARTVVQYTASTGQISNLSYSGSYVYKRGLGPKSRGGELYPLPVRMENSLGQVVATDQSYVLYNPAFYLFGNLFSGDSTASKLDFSSRSGATSNQGFPSDFSNKLNSEASLYNYSFDKNSVLYWDNNKSTADYEYKNKELTESIKKLTGPNPPPEVCPPISASDIADGKHVFLNNENCVIGEDPISNTWPDGRVWYLRASGDVELSATFHSRGTIIIDYAGGTPGNVRISTLKEDFPDNAALGLIVINGGNVLFANAAQKFNGIIFDPGTAGSSQSCTISFEEGGNPVKVSGSLVSDTICFKPRLKSSSGYSVSIYSDQKILNSSLPGFENLMKIIVGY